MLDEQIFGAAVLSGTLNKEMEQNFQQLPTLGISCSGCVCSDTNYDL